MNAPNVILFLEAVGTKGEHTFIVRILKDLAITTENLISSCN